MPVMLNVCKDNLDQIQRLIPHLTPDDLATVQARLQELADFAWKELEKR